MKYLQVFMLMLLIGFAGCNQDTLIDPSDDAVTMRSPEDLPMLPLHGEVVQTIDPSGGFLTCIPTNIGLPEFPRMFTVEGIVSHLGRLQGGTLEVLNCALNPETGALVGDVTGTWIAANGDMVYFSGYAFVNADGSAGGELTIEDGTGRWENACGAFTTQSGGQVDEMSSIVIIDGEICAPGHIK